MMIKILDERKIHKEELWLRVWAEVECMMRDEALNLHELAMIADSYYRILRISDQHHSNIAEYMLRRGYGL